MRRGYVLVFIVAIALVTSAMAADKYGGRHPRLTERGELFLLEVGETEEIFGQGERIEVELIEIGHNPEEVSDMRLDYIELSDENPDPGEEVGIEVSITNIGTGAAYAVSLSMTYGDEHLGGDSPSYPMIEEIDPGETEILEFVHIYEEEGEYTIMAFVDAPNDINMGNNVECEQITVGDPQGGSSGGCGAFGPREIPKKAHIGYEVTRGQVAEYETFWVGLSDIGEQLEILKLSDLQALLSIPN